MVIKENAGQPPLSDLLGLFAQLNIDVPEDYYVDYIFVKYKLKKLPDLTQEMIDKQKQVLINMKSKENVKLEFRKHLLEIQAKLRRDGWGIFDKEDIR